MHTDLLTANRFGDELYRLRLAAGLTPTELARQCGLTRGYYSRLENSKRIAPPSKTVLKLCCGLQLSPLVAERLQYLAYAERVATEAPAPLAKLVGSLAEKAYRSSPGQMSQVYRALEEVISM